MVFSLASFYIVILVYATQQRDDKIAELREQLTLELALLSEQKTAKVPATLVARARNGASKQAEG